MIMRIKVGSNMEPVAPPPAVLWLTKDELQVRMAADGYVEWQVWVYTILCHKIVVAGDLKFKWLSHFQ